MLDAYRLALQVTGNANKLTLLLFGRGWPFGSAANISTGIIR